MPNPKGDKTGEKTDDKTGWACMKGNYCPEGTVVEIGCPEGTFNDGELAQDASDCQDVAPGKFISVMGATSATFATSDPNLYGNCKGGYICYGGSPISAPDGMSTGALCSPGKYCPPGSDTELNCPPGTYSRTRGAEVCEPCEAGTYCPETGSTDSDTICGAFHYCPKGSSRQLPCPAGTFSISTGTTVVDDCNPCPGGIACETPATEDDTLQCAAGYVCDGKSAYEKPMYGIYDAVNILNGFCPQGSYCTQGSGSPTECSPGQYQNAIKASECKPCPRGYACSNLGMIEVSDADKCEVGFFCNRGQLTKIPDTSKCDINHYCMGGTTYQMMCPDGQYQASEGKGTCDPCPSGKVCFAVYDIPTSKQIPIINDCPAFSYCPGGNGPAGVLCEPGTYSTLSTFGLKAASECEPCNQAYYCIDGRGLNNADYAAGKCSAGYYCRSGAKTPTPKYCPPSATCVDIPINTDPEEAYYCPPGHFCGPGITNPSRCPSGKFRLEPGAMIEEECTVCLPGQYCLDGRSVPVPCPKGSYCPPGSSTYKECPMGTYNPNERAMYESACVLCPPSYYCKDTGISDLSGYKCPPSSYCLEGAIIPIRCLAGFFISGGGDSENDCNPCTELFYCPSGATQEEYCPDGYECPPFSPAPSICQPGYCCFW